MKVSSNKSPRPVSSNGPAAGPKSGNAGKKKPVDVFDKALKGKDLSEQDLLKQQKQLADHAEQMSLKSNVLAMEHDMMKSIIQNIRY